MPALPPFSRHYILRSRPIDLPGPLNFEIEQVDHPVLELSEFRVAVRYVALSPWQGQRLKDFSNYTHPFEIGELIDCDVLGEIVESGSAVPNECGVGQIVTGRLGWQEFAVTTAEHVRVESGEFDPTLWLTALSSSGLTAYCAMDMFGRPMPGQSMVVTSAAGAVGGYAVQLGKLAGMHVVGVAGGQEKCTHVVEILSADACVDYRADDYHDQLKSILPDGGHLVFDTVGGPVADVVFDNIAKYATVLIVGRTMSNNSDRPNLDPVNMRQLWAREATVQGFSRYSYPRQWAFARERMMELCRRGAIKSNHNTVMGFEQTPQALHDMLAGKFIEKVLVRYDQAA